MALTKNTSQGTFYFQADDQATVVEQVVREIRTAFPHQATITLSPCYATDANGFATGKMVVKITLLGDDEIEIRVRDVEFALDRCRYAFEDAIGGKLPQLALFDTATGETKPEPPIAGKPETLEAAEPF